MDCELQLRIPIFWVWTSRAVEVGDSAEREEHKRRAARMRRLAAVVQSVVGLSVPD